MRLIFLDVKHPNPGGADNLVYTLARFNFLKHKAPSVIFGEEESFAVRRLKGEQIPYFLFDNNNWSCFKPGDNDIYIHFSNNEWLSRVRRFPGRAIVWAILPSLIYSWNRFEFENKLYGRKILAPFFNRNFVNDLLDSSALCCMDGATRDSINASLGVCHQFPLLPVPFVGGGELSKNRRFRTERRNYFCVSYIGRSDDIWKIFPLAKICKDLSGLSSYEFKINVYTDDKAPFLKMLAAENAVGTNMTVDFFLGFWGERLREHLWANSDIHFSMGMSALEGGLLKIPTILIDPSYGEFPRDYKYNWLYKTLDFSLGTFLPKENLLSDGLLMSDVIENAMDAEESSRISSRCFEYVVNNHSVDEVLKKIADQPGCSNFYISARTPSSWIPRKHFF